MALLLLLVGAYSYQASSKAAQNVNNNCPANELCPTANPNPQFLILEYIGSALIVVAALFGAIQFWSSRRAPQHPTEA